MRKLQICLLFIFINYHFASAQSDTRSLAESDNENFTYAGLYLSPSYLTGRHYKYYHFGSAAPMDYNLVKGFQFGKAFKDKVNLQVGFEFFANSYLSDNKYDHPQSPFQGKHYIASYDVNYYQLPLTVKLLLGKEDRKLRLYFPFGLVYRNQSINENISEFNSENKIENQATTKFEEHFIFSHIGFGGQLTIGNKINIFVEPNLRQNIWYKDKESQQLRFRNELSYGFNIGINYIIN